MEKNLLSFRAAKQNRLTENIYYKWNVQRRVEEERVVEGCREKVVEQPKGMRARRNGRFCDWKKDSR